MHILAFIQKTKYWLIFSLMYIKILCKELFSKNKSNAFILSTPRHGNLGDHAIVFSQHKLLKSLRLNTIEINETTYAVCKKRIPILVKPQDIIIIDGGGNIGTLWPEAENTMRDIIKRFPNNPIFIMPQTAYFERSEHGKNVLRNSVDIYNSHPDLTIFCRDEITFKLISDIFNNVKSHYTPDMVMFLNYSNTEIKREGALICFREDLEKFCSIETKNRIFKFLEEANINYSNSSTVIDKKISFKKRKKSLLDKWKEFCKAEIVITDRLHGMIFCAITSTPCLAIDNVSHKVRDGYKWLQHLPYIMLCDEDTVDIGDKLSELIALSKNKYTYDTNNLNTYYELIKNEITSRL